MEIYHKRFPNSIYLFLVLYFLSTSLFTNAQYIYEKGCIINNEGDTLCGYIETGNVKMNSLVCKFKTDTEAREVLYSPDEIQGYYILQKKVYISKLVPVSEGKLKRLFLEYLVDGVIDLYFYTDRSGNDQFFIEKDGQIEKLSNETFTFRKDGKFYSGNTHRYIGILKYYTYDYPQLSGDIDNMKFNHESFIKITKKYHEYACDSVGCIIYYKKEKKLNDSRWTYKLGLYGGYSRGTFMLVNRLESINTYTIVFGPLTGNYAPVIVESNLFSTINKYDTLHLKNSSFTPGFYLNITRSWRTSLQLGMSYDYFSLLYNGGKFQAKMIRMPIQLKREFFYYHKLSPYITFGIDLNLHTKLDIEDYQVNYTLPILDNDTITYSANKHADISLHGMAKRFQISALTTSIGLSYDISNRSSINFEIEAIYTTLNAYFVLNEDLLLYSGLNNVNFSFILTYSYHLNYKDLK